MPFFHPSIIIILLMRVFALRPCRAVLRGMTWRVDRVVVDRDCVVAFSCRVEDARQTALGDEVPRTVDVAVGPSFRGTHKPYSRPTYPSNPQPQPFFFLSSFFPSLHVTLTMLNRWGRTAPDHSRINHHPRCVSTQTRCSFPPPPLPPPLLFSG